MQWNLARIRELRSERRTPVQLPVQIDPGDRQSFINCFMTDVSAAGARLRVPHDVRLPDTFMLYLGGANQARRQCELIWQNQEEIGMKFSGRPAFTVVR
jgi:hypothetical protein